MNKIVIRHVSGSDPAQFQAVRLDDGKSVGPIAVPSPIGFPVEGMPNSHLMRELRWYLEVFLDHPFPPFTNRAERILAALRAWGTQAFNALFADRASGRLLDAATSEQYSDLHLEISSDDPKILYWPWEALHDSEVGDLAKTCQISRRLNQVRDPHPISKDLPKNQINILLVTARPYDGDVRFRSISRPVIDLIARDKLPAQVTLLRPPTFDQLRSHLRAHPNHYHILHFDGHGGYGTNQGHHDPHSLQGPQGKLVFETADGKPDPQKASVLSELLREYSVPVVVLNACQSAMVDEAADDAFASVAAGLQKSGVRSVVAMAYSLYVSGAQQFLPAFYQRLFENGNVANAVQAGRQQAEAHPERVCARGTFPLSDWLVPVLYEQDAFSLLFANSAKPAPADKPDQPTLPDAAQDSENPYGFIGRDGALLALERAMHRPPAGILIQGFGGIGKTTLARGFAQWLATTGGLGQGCLWFSFQEIRSAEYVINDLVGKLFDTKALAAPLDQKIAALVQALREHQYLLVWDNFEVVCGIEGTSLQPTLSAEDRQLLLSLLKKLRRGKTKVLLTSRSNEDWIDPATCFRLPIGGLVGEERWEYCEAIVRDLGLTVDRTNADWAKLMNMLDGHPLAMRVILSRLYQSSPSQLATDLEANLLQFASQDVESAKLFATLRFVQDGLPPDLQRLLVPLALHDQFVMPALLETMIREQTTEVANEGDVEQLIHVLNVAGLLHRQTESVQALHPALSRYLQLTVWPQQTSECIDEWCRLFVNVLASAADHFAAKQLHGQRGIFHIYGSNFHRAWLEAERLHLDTQFAALTRLLGAYALNVRNFDECERLFLRLGRHEAQRSYRSGEATAYHQLGRVEQERRNFSTSADWYKKSLSITEKLGDIRQAAVTYHQLGRVFQEQRDFGNSKLWFLKSLEACGKHGNQLHLASTYHQLGILAHQQRDFVEAQEWLQKSLEIKEKLDSEFAVGSTYHQLGSVAEELEDFDSADSWYRKSLAIAEKLGNQLSAISTYHQLAVIAQRQGNLVMSEHLCRRALANSEGYENQCSSIYLQLGRLAEAQRQFDISEQWYRKSLALSESQNNSYDSAIAYHQLGRLSEEQGDLASAGEWSLKAIKVFLPTDEHKSAIELNAFKEIYEAANGHIKNHLKHAWQAANIGPWPFDDESSTR
jgi:tetratricopeptide (TPR) repeat protein